MVDKLDKEEKNLLELFEKNQLKSSKNTKQETAIAMKAAVQHMKKDARINIRISQFDLDRIKRIAATEGLPYQTLISSILHKYAKNMLDDHNSKS